MQDNLVLLMINNEEDNLFHTAITLALNDSTLAVVDDDRTYESLTLILIF